MYALFLAGNEIVGYKEITIENEEQEYLVDYVLVEVLPDVLVNGFTINTKVIWDDVNQTASLLPLPLTEKEKIVQLEEENANLEQRLQATESAILSLMDLI